MYDVRPPNLVYPKRKSMKLRVPLTCLLACVVLSIAAAGQSANAPVTVLHPIGHDVTRPLRDLPVIHPDWDNYNEHPVQPVPHGSAGGRDTVLQTTPITTTATISGQADFDRSEERRVGKECRSRWSP